MQINKLISGIGFRIAVLTAILVMIALIILGTAVYIYVSQAAQQRVQDDVRNELAHILSHAGSAAPNAIAEEIDRRRSLEAPRQFFYNFATVQGQQLAGDTWLRTLEFGWQRLDANDDAKMRPPGADLLTFGEKIGTAHVLVVGRNISWIAEVEDELLEILGMVLLAGVVLSGLTAFIVNRLLANRIGMVTHTASAIMDGNLSQRIPLTGSDDDFDHLSQTLNNMLDRLAALMENLEQVSNDIAHDLRTPLGRLRQGLEHAQRTADSTDEYAQAIDNAIGEADGLLELFSALLRIAQIDAGAPRADFRRVDLSELIASVAEAYELNAEESGYALTSRLEPGLTIMGDRDLLTQLFANLIENALTHTPSGTRIELTLTKQDGAIKAAVADNGPGVPHDKLNKIFDRFYRLEESRTTPGTGLGLSLVAAISQLHGGSINALSNEPGLRVQMTFRQEETT